jgi:hypothetical protein
MNTFKSAAIFVGIVALGLAIFPKKEDRQLPSYASTQPVVIRTNEGELVELIDFDGDRQVDAITPLRTPINPTGEPTFIADGYQNAAKQRKIITGYSAKIMTPVMRATASQVYDGTQQLNSQINFSSK